MDENATPPIDPTVERTIIKLRAFLADLDPAERGAMAALLVPAVERASYQQRWTPAALRLLLSDTDMITGRRNRRR